MNPINTFADLWVLCLLPIPVAVLFFCWKYKRTAAVNFPHISEQMKRHASLRSALLKLPLLLRAMALLLIVLALARPQFGYKSEEVISPGTDIVICLDTSPSMLARDFRHKDRLDMAKEVITRFIHNRKYDRIGLVVFSGAALSVCPLTSDHDALLNIIPKIDTSITGTDGTAIGDALAVSVNRLKSSQAKSKVIILVTDGRSNMGHIDPISAAKLAADMKIKIYSVGVAKKGNSVMPQLRFGVIRYVPLDEDLDEETLQEIASVTSGVYSRSVDETSLNDIFNEIDRLEKTDIKIRTDFIYHEQFNQFLFPALLLLCLELLLNATLLRRVP